MFVLDTRNRDQLVRSLPPEERKRVNGWTLRIENSFDPATSRWKARWFRLRRATAKAKEGAQELIGESEIRLYSAHELSAMLRPERWSRVELYGASTAHRSRWTLRASSWWPGSSRILAPSP